MDVPVASAGCLFATATPPPAVIELSQRLQSLMVDPHTLRQLVSRNPRLFSFPSPNPLPGCCILYLKPSETSGRTLSSRNLIGHSRATCQLFAIQIEATVGHYSVSKQRISYCQAGSQSEAARASQPSVSRAEFKHSFLILISLSILNAIAVKSHITVFYIDSPRCS